MRLSDAIATGRVLVNPKAFVIDDGLGSGCALGMALKSSGSSENDMERRWPFLFVSKHKLPCECDKETGNLHLMGSIITHLFDFHVMGSKHSVMFFGFDRWSLDQLIDWVRSVEPTEETFLPENVQEPEYASIT